MTAQLFNFGQHAVRVVIKEGQPWFVLKDVCNALDVDQAAGVKRRLEEDVISKHPLHTSGGMQNVNIVSEDGLYDVVFDSNKPEARKFRKWVTSEVLPSIRKHGVYAADEILNNPDLLIDALQALKEERAQKERLTARVNILEPKAKFAEAVTASVGSMPVDEAAKAICERGYKIGERRLFAKLKEWSMIRHMMRSGSNRYIATQYPVERGWLEVVIKENVNSVGSTYPQTYVTAKGLEYIYQRLLKERSN